MAIQYIGTTISGVSGDTKPTLTANELGVLFVETNTDKVYQWDGDSWNEITSTAANLSGNTLNSDIVTSSLTTVGALNAGSITSGFGAIDTGSSNITTTGTITAGNLSVTGTTTTVNSTNTTISDRLIELASGAGSSTADAGIIIERGSTGDNAIIAWDESADRFVFGTTTATGSSTGDLTITTGSIEGVFIGNVTGNVSGNAGTVSGGVYNTGNQTIAGTKTFSSAIDISAGELKLSGGQSTLRTDNAYIRKHASTGEIHFDSQGSVRVNLDTNNNNTDKKFSIGSNASTSDVFSVAENGDTAITGTLTATNFSTITATGNITTQGNYFYDFIADDSYGGLVLRNDTRDGTHIQWELNKRNTNLDLWLLAYDGTTWKNVVKWDWANMNTLLGGNLQIAADGYIAFGDTSHLIDVNAGYMLFKMPANEDFYWQQGSTNMMHLDTSAATLHVGSHDAINGLINITGGAAGNDEGGELRLFTAADHDGTYDYYFLDAYQDDLRIGRAGNVDMSLSAAGNFSINRPTYHYDNVTIDEDGGWLYIKGGGVGTNSTGIAWTFSTANTRYSEIQMDYDTRASVGLLIHSAYPITIDGTTQINFDLAGTTYSYIDSTGNLFLTDGTLYVDSGSTDTVAKFESSDANAYVQILDSDSTGSHPPGFKADGDDLYLFAGSDANGWQKGIMLDDDGFIRMRGHVAFGNQSVYDIGHSDSQWTSAGLRVGGTNGWMIGNTTDVQRISNNSGTFSMLNSSNAWANLQVAEIQINSTIIPYNNNPLKVDNGTNADSSIRVQHNDNYYLELDPDLVNMHRASGSSANLTISTTSAGTPASGAGKIILDSLDDIDLDAASYVVSMKGTGTEWLKFYSASSDSYIYAPIQDKDMYLRVNDGGTQVNAIFIDASDHGHVYTNHDLTLNNSGTLNAGNITVAGAQGSDGQVLTSTGSGVAWEDAGGGGKSIAEIIAWG